MDSDFHYYGTGAAALAAGFNKSDATLIANVAQYVDWFNSDYWSYWKIVQRKGKGIEQVGKEYSHPQLSVQTIDWKMMVDYDKDIWNAFHFLPGNVAYTTEAKSGWKKKFADAHVVRKTRLNAANANKLCRPYSEFAFSMIENTLFMYKALSTMNDTSLASVLPTYFGDTRERVPVKDGVKLAKFLLGIRMHILSDTWAHQDFTGEQTKEINGAGTLNSVYTKDTGGHLHGTEWTGTLWALHDDTDCAAAPDVPGDSACAGHGQMGHYPDYSWLTFIYPASWLPNGVKYMERNNPAQYNEAWSWISFVMGLCSGKKTQNQIPDPTPDKIQKIMSTPHTLSTTKLKAVAESEKLWKEYLGNKLGDMWKPSNRKELGLYDGLATTRLGYINVERESTLHYMETASAIHYSFCRIWTKNNSKKYSWRPEPART